jgi:GDP-L-fucose synthase
MKRDLTSQRILVTGGGGFLGSHIIEELRRRGCAQIAAPRRRDDDLTQAESVWRLFEQFRPELVIHAAATVGGIGANRENPGKFFYENALMGIHVI